MYHILQLAFPLKICYNEIIFWNEMECAGMESNFETQLQAANALRAAWAASDRKRDEGLMPRVDVVKLTDLSYQAASTPEDAIWQLADVYYPKGHTEGLYPVIVNVHGGGWFYGDKLLYAPYGQYLAAQGFAVVNFNYRLAPEHKYPAAFADVCALMEYLAENAPRLQLDLSRLYMVGDSAGAQLTAQYAVFVTNAAYRGLFTTLCNGNYPVPSKLALNCGAYHAKGDRTDEIVSWYLPDDADDALAHSLFAVLDYLTPQFPQCFVMASVNDDLLTESRILHQRLSALQHTHIYREYGQDNPENGHVFHLNLRSDEGLQCNADEVAFFKG